MLETLLPLPQSQLPRFLSSLNQLVMHKPGLFQPHLQPLLNFLGPQILPDLDAVSTPTESKPFPSNETSAPSSAMASDEAPGLDEDKEATMRAALEFMITLVQAGSALQNIGDWISAILKGCLEGMAILGSDTIEEWLEADEVRTLYLSAHNYLMMDLTPCRLLAGSWTTPMHKYANTLSVDLLSQ